MGLFQVTCLVLLTLSKSSVQKQLFYSVNILLDSGKIYLLNLTHFCCSGTDY